MKSSTRSIKITWMSMTVALLAAAFVVINIFGIGGADFVYNLNSFSSVPLAVGVTLGALLLWQRAPKAGSDKLLWGGLALGWGMWALAEAYWAIASLLGQEVPYPSFADALWLLGYTPMYIAIVARGRSLPRVRTNARRWGFILVSVLTLAVTIIFVLMPLIQGFDPAAVIASALSLMYPLADLVLLLLILQLFFNYQHGVHGRAWLWIMAGFVLTTAADLMFSYAVTTGVYYPEGELNFISTIGVDVPYTLSYLLMLVGLERRLTIEAAETDVRPSGPIRTAIPNTHVLVFTSAEDVVTHVSDNFAHVMFDSQPAGKSIAAALGLSAVDAASILKPLRSKKTLAEAAYPVRTRHGTSEGRISGVVLPDGLGGYGGCLLLIRLVSEEGTLDAALTAYQKGLVKSIMESTGAGKLEENEFRSLVAGYYEEALGALQDRVIQEGGATLAGAFFEELRSLSEQRGWSLELDRRGRPSTNAIAVAELPKALPVLLEAAKNITRRFTDEASVNKTMEAVQMRYDPATLLNILAQLPIEEKGREAVVL